MHIAMYFAIQNGDVFIRGLLYQNAQNVVVKSCFSEKDPVARQS